MNENNKDFIYRIAIESEGQRELREKTDVPVKRGLIKTSPLELFFHCNPVSGKGKKLHSFFRREYFQTFFPTGRVSSFHNNGAQADQSDKVGNSHQSVKGV